MQHYLVTVAHFENCHANSERFDYCRTAMAGLNVWEIRTTAELR